MGGSRRRRDAGTHFDYTHDYAAFCDRVARRFIHHEPDDAPGDGWPTAPQTGGVSLAATIDDGNTLVHTDVTPRNFLIGDRVAVVDWATPCRAGHSAVQAEKWATAIPAWRAADPEALDEFAAAVADLYRQRHHENPAPHRGPLAAVASRWAQHRRPALLLR